MTTFQELFIKDIIEKTKKSKNVGIFIDYDNLYYTYQHYGLSLEHEKYSILDTLNKIYLNKIRQFHVYADFQQNQLDLNYIQQRHAKIEHVYGNGLTENNRKNASDIQLSIDVMETLWKNKNIDTYVLVTSDCDFLPIEDKLLKHGKTVHLYYMRNHISKYQNITTHCNLAVDLMNLYGIDENRMKPEYWEKEAIQTIRNWYANPKNKGKTLGYRWLNDLFTSSLEISKHLSSEIIQHLLEKNTLKSLEIEGNKEFHLEE